MKKPIIALLCLILSATAVAGVPASALAQTPPHAATTEKPAERIAAKPEPVATAPATGHRPQDEDDVSTLQTLLSQLAARLSDTGYAVTVVISGIGLLLFLQVVVLIVQTFVSVKYVGLVRAEVAHRNRPKLVLRHIGLEIFTPGKLAKVQWLVENMGNSTAVLIDARATLLVARDGILPAIPEYDSRNHAIAGELKLDSARSMPFVQFSQDDIAAGDHAAVYRGGEGAVFFFGYLLYTDETEIRRRVGFCRQLDVHSGRFLIIDDPNYEFAD